MPTTRVGGFVLLLVLSAAPALAQVDLAGEWAARSGHEDQPHRVVGPDLGDYTGIPLNDAARLKARTWDASVLSQRERQAQPHPATYSMRGPGPNFRMNKVVEPRTFELVAYTITGLFGNADRTIWLDGRSHPSELAEHTWNGFSTGTWERGALKVFTTHIKAGTVQRNGVPTSPYATMTEYFIRHGDHMLLVSIVDDPIYFEEPFIRTSNFVWAPNQTQARPAPFEIVDEVAGQGTGWVPSHPLGTVHTGFARAHGLPFEATQGGSASVRPEYARRIREMSRDMPTVAAPLSGPPPPRARPARTTYEVLPVQGSLYLVAGPGGNVVVQAAEEGLLLVDTGAAGGADGLREALRSISPRPVTTIINTSADSDHVGANGVLAQAGTDRGGNAPGNSGFRIETAPIIAHENVLRRVSAPSGEPSVLPFIAWPTSTYFTERKTMFYGEEPIEILSQPSAHTDGDSIVFFRRSDVIAAGDIFMTDRYPVFDPARGGSLQGVIDGLNRIIDLAIPRFNQQGGTLVVPGHGRIGNESDVTEYRDMATIIRDRIRAMIQQGLTLEQVKAARPTLDYDGIYGAIDGAWTTDMFVEAVYRDLSRTR